MLSTSAMSAASKKVHAPSTQVQATYGIFASVCLGVYYFIANAEFSAVLTMAVLLQCLGFALLSVQTFTKGTAQGISVRSLGLDALAIVLRLSSTTWLHGYLPVDASGDYVYQAVDFVSLGIVAWLLHRVLVEKRSTYQDEDDDCAVAPMIIGALLLAALLHADMNARPLFDTLWMAGLFLSVVSVLPQLWLISKNKGKVEALTSHYIAAIALSRMMSGVFMWYARHDITCEMYMDGVNHAIWAILSAHLIHILLLADFAFYYVRAILNGQISCGMALGDDFV